ANDEKPAKHSNRDPKPSPLLKLINCRSDLLYWPARKLYAAIESPVPIRRLLGQTQQANLPSDVLRRTDEGPPGRLLLPGGRNNEWQAGSRKAALERSRLASEKIVRCEGESCPNT